MKINNFRGDLTDISAKKGALLNISTIELGSAQSDSAPSWWKQYGQPTCLVDIDHRVLCSIAVLAEISLTLPRKLFIFIIKYIFTGSKHPKK